MCLVSATRVGDRPLRGGGLYTTHFWHEPLGGPGPLNHRSFSVYAAPVTRCPTCKRPVAADAIDTVPPFCSQRCKLVDLDSWFSGRYVVSEPLGFDETQGLLPSEDE